MNDEDKNGNRRSSILKQPKSPRQVLQELENNEPKAKESIKSKLERRSSRRVSFADTCQVQEFCKEISSYASSSETHCTEMEICRGFPASAAPQTIQQAPPPSTLPSRHSLLTGQILYLPLSVVDTSKGCEIVSKTAVELSNREGAQATTDRIPLKVLNPDDFKSNNAANSEEFQLDSTFIASPVKDADKGEFNRTIYMNEGNNSMELTCADTGCSEPRLSIGKELKDRQRTIYFDNQHDEMDLTTANSFSLYVNARDASTPNVDNLPMEPDQIFFPIRQTGTALLPANASTRGDHEPICESETNMAFAHVDANLSSARVDPASCDVEIQQSASSVSANFETKSIPAGETCAAAGGREERDEDMEFTEVENFSIIVSQEDFKSNNLQDHVPTFEKCQATDARNVFMAPGSEDCPRRGDRVPDLHVAGVDVAVEGDVNMDFSKLGDSIVSGSSDNLLPVCSTARDDLNPASFFKSAMHVSLDEITDPLDDSVFLQRDDSMEIVEPEVIPKEETPTNISVKSTVVTSLPNAATNKDDVTRNAVGATIMFDGLSGNMELTSCTTRSHLTRTPTLAQHNYKTVMFEGTSGDMDLSMDCAPTDVLTKTREEKLASVESLHVVGEIDSIPQAVASPRRFEPPLSPDLEQPTHRNDEELGCEIRAIKATETAAQNDNLTKSLSPINLLARKLGDGHDYGADVTSCSFAPAPQNEASVKSLCATSLITAESVRKSTDNLNSDLKGGNIIVPDSAAVAKEIMEMSRSLSLSKAEAQLMLDAPAEPSSSNSIVLAEALSDHTAQTSFHQAEDKSVTGKNDCEGTSDEPQKLSNSPLANKTLLPENEELFRSELRSESEVVIREASALIKVASSADKVSDLHVNRWKQGEELSTNVKNSDVPSTEVGKLQKRMSKETNLGDGTNTIAEVHNSLEICSAKSAGTKQSGAVSMVKVKVRQQKRQAPLIEQPDVIPCKQAMIQVESSTTETDSEPRTSKPKRRVAQKILESSSRRAVVRYGFSQEATLDETRCLSTSVAPEHRQNDEVGSRESEATAAAVVAKDQDAKSEESVQVALGDGSIENIMEISCPTLVNLTETVSFCAADEKEYCIGDECSTNIEEVMDKPVAKPEEAGTSEVQKTGENGDNPALGGFSGAVEDASILNSSRRPHRQPPLHNRLLHMYTASSTAKCGTKRGSPKAESEVAWLNNKRNVDKPVADSTPAVQTNRSSSLGQQKLAEIADQEKDAAYQARIELMLLKMSGKNVPPSKGIKQEANEVMGRKTSPHGFLEPLETAKQLIISRGEASLKGLVDLKHKIDSYNSENRALQTDTLLKSAEALKEKVDRLREDVNNIEIVKVVEFLNSPVKEKTRSNKKRKYNVVEWTSKCIHISFYQNVLHLKFCLGDVIDTDDPLTLIDTVEDNENREILNFQKWSTLKDDCGPFCKLAHRCMWDALDHEKLETTCKNTRRLQQILPTLIMYSEDAMTLYLDLKRIGFGHVIEVRDSSVVMVEFVDLDAFLNFQLEFTIEPGVYPNRRLQPELKVIIGQIRNEDLQNILRAVNLGPSYLFRLVDAIDQWLKSCSLPQS